MRDWLQLPFSHAGASARHRFNELAARWRRRSLKRLRLFTAIVLPALLVGALFERHYGAWALGLATGAVVALFMSIRDEVPAYIEAWRAGYMGERKTARVLAPLLRDGCLVLHDLPDRRTEAYTKGNVDHVLVAPWGVFVLDSKMWGGSVSVDGDAIRVKRIDDDESDESLYDRLAIAVRGQAVRLKEDIEDATSITAWVQAVVVLWCPFEAAVVTSNRVTYVHGDHLADWLARCQADTSAAARMNPERLARIADGINRARPREANSPWQQSRGRAGLRRHPLRDDRIGEGRDVSALRRDEGPARRWTRRSRAA